MAHAVKQLDATLSYPLFAQNRAKWTKARIVANKFLQTQEGLWLKERKLISVESIIVN